MLTPIEHKNTHFQAEGNSFEESKAFLVLSMIPDMVGGVELHLEVVLMLKWSWIKH
jgi:hypothetical protein